MAVYLHTLEELVLLYIYLKSGINFSSGGLNWASDCRYHHLCRLFFLHLYNCKWTVHCSIHQTFNVHGFSYNTKPNRLFPKLLHMCQRGRKEMKASHDAVTWWKCCSLHWCELWATKKNLIFIYSSIFDHDACTKFTYKWIIHCHSFEMKVNCW